ncbi:hypothetical protein AWB80_05549 [Caballeronia pedi]|uniref:DUF4123 domain-containing protein n=1 Tax=Caballeronia pedi TaxID=1777141 RepID=A0A158CNA3_9BURK|nr:DUF4123 domain-containing protein [Caballeronia pedi]SAK83802.1 hypothetical protein AWB80_05549 [Caballeronia pedi]
MLSSAESARPDWSRHVVQEVAEPAFAELQKAARPWLWLDGAASDTLEAEVMAITHRFDHRWVWRGTEREYQGPGYRQGPLLVPLDTALFDHFLTHWAVPGIGLVLLSEADESTLITHLQALHQIIAADGGPLRFSLAARRPLEELCEALPPHRLAELLGPIKTLSWAAEAVAPAMWLRIEAPANYTSSFVPAHAFTLTTSDEAKLDRASMAWFMRDTVRRLRENYPSQANLIDTDECAQHLALFADEARRLELRLERDVRQYLALRLVYPQESFERDAVLRASLMKLDVSARQRMMDLEDRLQQTMIHKNQNPHG